LKESNGGEDFSTLPVTESWESQQHRNNLLLTESTISEDKMKSVELGPIDTKKKPRNV